MGRSVGRYVIIGSGVASVSAAEAIRSLDTRGEIIMISDDPHGYYSRPGLAYYLTGEVEESFLFPFKETDFRRLGIRLIKAQVNRIDPSTHQIFLTNGQSLRYDRLLVAVGAQAVLPDTPGIQLDGVVKLDHLEDSRRILQIARRSRKAVVVGGGITALEIVEGLIACNCEVHYMLRGDHYWSNVLDETESVIVERRLKDEGVRIHYRCELDEVLGKKGRICGIRTRAGEILSADMLAVAIGIQPRLSLAKVSGITTGKGIQVDQSMRTSAPEVFAAGDVAEVIDQSGKSVMNTLWAPAREQGKIAGLNMAGGKAQYTRSPAFNVTRLAGLTTTIIGKVGSGLNLDLIGIARGDSETWRQLPDAIVAQRDFEVNRLRVLVGEKTLVGAVVMGDQTLSQPIQHLVSNSVDISAIREQILNRQESLGDLIAEFWTRWSHNEQPQVS